MACKQGFHANGAILDSSFYAYSAIMDSLVKVTYFHEKHYILQHYR